MYVDGHVHTQRKEVWTHTGVDTLPTDVPGPRGHEECVTPYNYLRFRVVKKVEGWSVGEFTGLLRT